MQVAGEVYLQLLAHLAEVVRAVENHPAGRAVKSRGLLALSWLQGLSGRVREVGDEALKRGAAALVAPSSLVDVASQVLAKGRTVPASICSSAYCAAVDSGSQLVDALRARWQQVDQLGGKMHATEVKEEVAAISGAGDGVSGAGSVRSSPAKSAAGSPAEDLTTPRESLQRTPSSCAAEEQEPGHVTLGSARQHGKRFSVLFKRYSAAQAGGDPL
ncbi:uncharacterized protein LOC134539313 [Bacillus rossius redtenbacheri]|uniref:uncharacterized protein LOC134539313 n=1 Tax=Bacillus rossius redtenbacheri TaxID=93214 RepID=UPI002FDE1AE7